MLGRFDEATQTYEKMVEITSHANGAYPHEETSHRSFFRVRLGAILMEQNKTDQALATNQKLIDMGSEGGGGGGAPCV